MITPEKKKELQRLLKEALLAEHMYNAKAAKYLNLIPNYITMMLNHRMWDHCPAKAWNRVEEALSLGKISEFKIPEGEKIVDGVKAHKNKGNALIGSSDKQKSESNPEEQFEENVSHLSSEEKKERISNLAELVVKNTQVQRLKVALDIEITLIVNGQKVSVV